MKQNNLSTLPLELVELPSSFPTLDYGIWWLSHAIENVPELAAAVNYVKKFTGFHKFAEFTTEDRGTSESGLNLVFLGNNDQMVDGVVAVERTSLWDEEEDLDRDLFGAQ